VLEWLQVPRRVLERLFAIERNANRSRKVKKHLCLVCGALTGITIVQSSALAETGTSNSTAAAPASSSAPLKTNGQNSKTVVEDCEAEWRANQEAMMKRDMTEDSYVEQCSVKDDVPAIPSKPKPSDAPSAAPK
jgi:adenine-specific DNA glycosylase